VEFASITGMGWRGEGWWGGPTNNLVYPNSG
jgi:hypothetical protein